MANFFLIVGLIGLSHSAYSATQHRNYLRLTEQEFSALPMDIILQALLSLLLSCFGIISIVAQLKPIKITSEWENKTWDNIANRTSFYSFNHRGKYLFGNADLTVSKVTEYSDDEESNLEGEEDDGDETE